MFDCSNCVNNAVCQSQEQAKLIQKEARDLEHKYKGFYGRIIVNCDYFIAEKEEVCIQG